MRITNRMITEHAITHMSDNLEQLQAQQEKVSSMKKFQTASEDPVAASMTLNLKSTLRSIKDYAETASQADDFMNANETAFQQMENLAMRAETLILRGLNDTLGADERLTSLAPEIIGIIREAVDKANSKHNDKYIFSGVQADQPSYGIDPVTNAPVALLSPVNGVIQRTIGPDKTITVNFHADTVFNDFFTALDQARNALETNDTVALRSSLTALQSSLSTMDQYRTLNGTRMRQVQVAKDYLEKTKLEAQSLISKSEDINLAEGISLLNSQEMNYRVVLEVSQRAISTMNLFDYLR